MARAKRLSELISILRDGRLHRAQDLAARLGVSLRTIYRDMDTLVASGVPIEGARGYGYRATGAITLPPLNLTMTELAALHLGLAAAGQAQDPELSAAAASLSAKFDAVLPEDRSAPPAGFGFATYPFADAAAGFEHMPVIRSAIRARQKLAIRLDGQEEAERVIRPLEMDYWGRVWTITAWCERDGAFLVTRIDRIARLKVLQNLFVDEPGKTLADFRAQNRTASPAR